MPRGSIAASTALRWPRARARHVPDGPARASTRLRALLARDDRVLAVLGIPNAAHATIMEKAGCEAAFVGTGITGGNYTALADTGLLSATECLQFAGYIARAVSFPLILDGDTGHARAPPLPPPLHRWTPTRPARPRHQRPPHQGQPAPPPRRTGG